MATAHEAKTFIPPIDAAELARRNAEAIRLLDSWAEGDDDDLRDQRETLDVLRRGLGPGRDISARGAFRP